MGLEPQAGNEAMATLWFGIKGRVLGFLLKQGCDFDMAEDIISVVYDVMVKKLEPTLAPRQALTFGCGVALREWRHEQTRRARFVHKVQDDDGAWHDPMDFIVDTRMDDAAHTHTVITSRLLPQSMYDTLTSTTRRAPRIPILAEAVSTNTPLHVYVAPKDNGKFMCQACGQPTCRNVTARYCMPCSNKQRVAARYEGNKREGPRG